MGLYRRGRRSSEASYNNAIYGSEATISGVTATVAANPTNGLVVLQSSSTPGVVTEQLQLAHSTPATHYQLVDSSVAEAAYIDQSQVGQATMIDPSQIQYVPYTQFVEAGSEPPHYPQYIEVTDQSQYLQQADSTQTQYIQSADNTTLLSPSQANLLQSQADDSHPQIITYTTDSIQLSETHTPENLIVQQPEVSQVEPIVGTEVLDAPGAELDPVATSSDLGLAGQASSPAAVDAEPAAPTPPPTALVADPDQQDGSQEPNH
jgi:hypothetical protein